MQVMEITVEKDLSKLKRYHEEKRNEIRARLEEFSGVEKEGDRRIFEELCFCILTANTSAEMGLRAIAGIRNVIHDGGLEDVRSMLKKSGYRYPNKRAEYIVETRNRLKEDIGPGLGEKIASFDDKNELREYFVKNVKGFGFKEASHFLRNIGLRGYAILDKHILDCLFEYGVVEKRDQKSPKNRNEYLEIEEKMKQFSRKAGIDFDELDLLFWSSKTGKILK